MLIRIVIVASVLFATGCSGPRLNTDRQIAAALTPDQIYISYREKGISFTLDRATERVIDTGVTEPLKPAKGGTVGNDEIVAGVGVYGFKIGSGSESLKTVAARAKECSGTDISKTGTSGVKCSFSDGREMYTWFVNNKAEYIEVRGKFRTREGITGQSTRRDIIKAYGEPEMEVDRVSSEAIDQARASLRLQRLITFTMFAALLIAVVFLAVKNARLCKLH